MSTLDISDAVLNIRATKGKAITIYGTVRDSSGALLNLSGYSTSLVIYDRDTLAVVATFTGSITAGAVVRQVTIALTETQSNTVPVENCIYKWFLVNSGGDDIPWMTGVWEQVF